MLTQSQEDNKYSLNQRICAIRSDKIEARFLYYHLNKHPYLLNFDNGENQTNLRKEDILKCPLYIPLIEEQKRIVEILDKAFEGIAQAEANTRRNLIGSFLIVTSTQ
ncbi:restriction endonuclease subunit S, partial [Microcystis sp.]|uniref:restriction endonuclease subunit S n=1 Tax=Microcystis sp. TaxID=1127 RepID=UPI00391D12AF